MAISHWRALVGALFGGNLSTIASLSTITALIGVPAKFLTLAFYISMKKRIIITAAIFGMLAVIAGAFGAHGLQESIAAKDLEVWHTAVQYQFYHVFALLFLSTLTRYKARLVFHCYYLFSLGIILFSGSLYLLACSELIGWPWLQAMGPVTPIGGLLFIAGWVTLAIAVSKIRFNSEGS